jgi:hypothetical protein
MQDLPIAWPLPDAWGCCWQKNEERISFTDEEGGCLRINFVPNCHGLCSGASFRGNPGGVLPADAATLRYSIYFPPDFDFVKGGKLPGMNIGTHPMDCSSGGEWSDTGGSFRIMFRERGAAIGYMYAPLPGAGQGTFDVQSEAFRAVAAVKGGAGIDLFHSRNDDEDMMLKAGEWNTFEIKVKLNTPGEADGSFQVTCNGKTKGMDGVTWRLTGDSQINAVNFVAFFGGGSDDWNSPKEQYCLFKDVSFCVGV